MNASNSREPVHFLVFSASLRSESLNTRLAQLAAVTIAVNGGEVDLASMRDFDAPSYDADAQDGEGRIASERLQERFDTNIVNFMDSVEAQKHYPCVKKAWVEYLGEHPEPVINRVEST